jgi:hypothetical protein
MVDILLYMQGSDSLPSNVPKWLGLPIRWEGADGSSWDLTDRSRGVYLRPGVRGLNMPQYDRFSSTAALVPGSRHKGSRALDREVYLPAKVWRNEGSTEFMEFDRAWWKAFDPDIEGRLVVTHPDGATRNLPCRFVEVDDDFGKNPIRRGWADYKIRLLADSVFWRGEVRRESFRPPAPRNFYVTEADRIEYGYADDVIEYYSPGGSLESAAFKNDGDEALWPVWTAIGPMQSVSFGPLGGSIIVPFEIPAGFAVKIDTNPADPTARVLWYGQWNATTRTITNPVNRSGELNSATRYMPILPGESQKLNISMSGIGTVVVEGTPQYRRAW